MLTAKRRGGFTLVELLIAVAIVSVLAAVILPRMSRSSDNARVAKCESDISTLNTLIETVGTETGRYPRNQGEFRRMILENEEYFPHGLPECPFGQAYRYDATKKTVIPHNHSN